MTSVMTITDTVRVTSDVTNHDVHNWPRPTPIILMTSLMRVCFSLTTPLTIIPTDNIQLSVMANGNIHCMLTKKLHTIST